MPKHASNPGGLEHVVAKCGFEIIWRLDDVRFGSAAEAAVTSGHVRFYGISGRHRATAGSVATQAFWQMPHGPFGFIARRQVRKDDSRIC